MRVSEPLLSPGVILGNASNPMRNVTFDNVRFDFGTDPLRGSFPFGRAYQCDHAAVQSVAGTVPAPKCVGLAGVQP